MGAIFCREKHYFNERREVMSVIQTNSSVTHTFGNVTCFALDYIKKYFEDDFFKVVHVSTKLAYRQLNILRAKGDFWKLHKPILIMRPRIEMDDASKYFYGSAMMNRMTNVRSPMEFTNIVNLVEDKQRGASINFMWNRMKIYYDVVMIFDTYNEQLNTANYLMNMIVPDTPFLVRTSLESYVPRNMVYTCADFLGVERENTAEILQFLNTYGKTPFTYKFKDGSGNNEFFSLYETNIEVIPSELSIDDGSQNGSITDSFTISFTLSCEFNAMGCYYLFLRDGDDRFRMCPHTDITKAGTLVPLFTIPLFMDIQLEPGWKIQTAPSFFVESNQTIDSVNLREVLDSGMMSLLHFIKGMNLDRSTFIRFRVFKDKQELYEYREFSIDLEDLNEPTLRVFDCDPKVTYRLFVIVNSEYINSISAEITEFNKEK